MMNENYDLHPQLMECKKSKWNKAFFCLIPQKKLSANYNWK